MGDTGSVSLLHDELLWSDADQDYQEDQDSSGGASVARNRKLGTFLGVTVPCICTIFGVVVFLRLPFIVGQMGLWAALAMLLTAYGLSFVTMQSFMAISLRKQNAQGGLYEAV